MSKKLPIVAVCGSILMFAFIGSFFANKANSESLPQNDIAKKELPICGGKTEKFLDPTLYKKEILSAQITEFSFSRHIPKSWDAYVDGEDTVVDFYQLSAKLNDSNEVEISVSGKNYRNENDDSEFRLLYVTKDSDFLARLNKFIIDNKLYEDNGHIEVVAGLQSGEGDTLKAKYESGELIYVQNNQQGVMDKSTSNKLYNLFKADAQFNGFDFTTSKSNVEIKKDNAN